MSKTTEVQKNISSAFQKERTGIALCLSGGGFRASLFHLGALRRLHELGVLQRVDTISSVSGGSIFAGFLANQLVNTEPEKGVEALDWEKDIADPFREFVKRDLRTTPFVAHLLWNWIVPRFRAQHLLRLYKKRISSLTLRQLPQRPRFIFCATDITFGVNWEFSIEKVGDYQAGYLKEAANWPIALAITASSCFPPIFGPLPIRANPRQFKGGNYSGADREKLLSCLGLSDGGVYDNMGIEPVWKNFAYVLVSDCGAPFQFVAGMNPIRRLLRYTTVVMNQAQSVRKRFFFSDINNDKFNGAYWSIQRAVKYTAPDSNFPGYSKRLVDEVISKIRTDLDSFVRAECLVLENHGYAVADESIRRRVPELIAASPKPFILPGPDWTDDQKIRLALRESHKRLSWRRLFGIV